MEYGSLTTVRLHLESIAVEFLKEAYGLELTVPVVINSRLKTTYGKFVYNKIHKTPLRIEIGKNYIDHQEWTTIVETLKHECIHYALFIQDMPFKDGHPVFEAELKKWGSHSTGTIQYRGKIVQYCCPSCGRLFNRKKRYPRNRTYRSGCCRANIQFVGEKVI